MREEYSSVVLPRLTLPSGAFFEELTQAYGDYGEGEETILVCHALTGSQHLAGERREGSPEPWWGAVVGDGMALDTRRFRIICFNNLASPYGSTSPLSINPADGRHWAMRFPILSPRDVAHAQKAALDALGVKHLRAVIGGSLGGMIALEFALSFPEYAGSCALIAAPDRLYPQAIAFNAVQRQSIMDDPEWKGGDYEGAGPVNGLAAARMLAMITYKSEQTFAHRYMREMADGAEGAWGGRFQIESYLRHHGEALVKRFDANCYLYLTRMMDLHDIGAERGGLDAAWKLFAGRRLLGLGISSDMLFPNWQVEEGVRAAVKNGVAAFYEEIESDNGHDSFLMDFDQVDEYLREFLYG